MRDIFYICAQPTSYYYGWQVDAMLLSFKENTSINLERVHIVGAILDGSMPDPWYKKVEEKWSKHGVVFEYYHDSRPKKGYVSSIRPHILEKHWNKYPWLVNETFFYHDSDIALTRDIPLEGKREPDQAKDCFVSDTKTYIGAKYIEGKGHNLLEEMCEIAQIDVDLVKSKEEESGGAQYLMKPGIDAQYWADVYDMCEDLFTKITARVKEIQKEEPDWHSLQIWCADMWAVIWCLWKRGYSTPVAKDLDFVWATQERWQLDNLSIYHNAGITKEIIDTNGHTHPFYKAWYTTRSPLQAPRPADEHASSWYFDLIFRAYHDTLGTPKDIPGISVVTLTWKRPELLEEAIQSFLLQDDPKAEMIIVNDDPSIEYLVSEGLQARHIRIFNTQPFDSFMTKFKFALEQSMYDYSYRLDDDDLLDEFALQTVRKSIQENPGFDIYRAQNHWFIHMVQPGQNGLSGGVNNGNTFSREFIKRLDWANAPEPPGEDQWYFHNQMARHQVFQTPTMLYRWAASQYSLTHKQDGTALEEFQTERTKPDNGQPTGRFQLTPRFREDWWAKKQTR